MSGETSVRLDDLTIAEADRVDAACDRFEAARAAGDPASIETFLAGASGPSRSVLLRELIELELRIVAGEVPNAEEYRVRFAEEAGLVDEVFADARDGWASRTTIASPDALPNPEAEVDTESASSFARGRIGSDDQPAIARGHGGSSARMTSSSGSAPAGWGSSIGRSSATPGVTSPSR